MLLTSLPIPVHVAGSILTTEDSCRIRKNQPSNARARSKKKRQLKGIEHSLATLLQMPLRARLLR